MSAGSHNLKLFINYRREDTAPYAGRLYDRLTAHFGEGQVFIDIDQIEPGEDFLEAINRKVAACDITIVSIGPDWLGATDSSGRRRLDDSEDFVRMEIVAALGREIRVIPVLVGGARMPTKQDLPEALAPLARRNAIELSETRFHADVNRLIEAIEKPYLSTELPESPQVAVVSPGRKGFYRKPFVIVAAVFTASICVLIVRYSLFSGTKGVEDEAKLAGLTTSDFPQITSDIFRGMDDATDLSPDEIMGRNAWNLWTAGNERFWNDVAQDSRGIIDLLKSMDNRTYKRGERFKTLGLMNQPGFRPPTKPDQFGLWLDELLEPERAGIDEKIYGKPTGVLGFRLFPNPDFNEIARQKWNAQRYISDPGYYEDTKLVRPYRVGVSCGACHIGPNPNNPPLDPENPRWENLSSAMGNQYIREGKVFAPNAKPGSFFYEELQAQPPGTSDISRIATDHINNPCAINPFFLLAERERTAISERQSGGALDLPGEKKDMLVAHLLIDGADSVGVPGAMLRFYVSMGMFSEYWTTRHSPLLGLTPQKPFEIGYARKHSIFWRATEERLANIADFFRRLKPYHLADAPAGASFISNDEVLMARGRQVFGENCAPCHSSKQPPWGTEAQSGGVKAWFRDAVNRPDFLENNFLSTMRRYTVAVIQTNSARALSTNAEAGYIWDNFSSQTYKALSPPDELECYNPLSEVGSMTFRPNDRGAGSGYYRAASLVSLWTSAPFLHNNSLGVFTGDPSVAGRMKAFNDAIEKLLWPEKRLGKASIRRVENECFIFLPKEFVPNSVQALANSSGYITFGPIPKGMPIKLIANLEPDVVQLVELNSKLEKTLLNTRTFDLAPSEITAAVLKAIPELITENKCPDLIEDGGHFFGTDLPDADKRALIEFLKTL